MGTSVSPYRVREAEHDDDERKQGLHVAVAGFEQKLTKLTKAVLGTGTLEVRGGKFLQLMTRRRRGLVGRRHPVDARGCRIVQVRGHAQARSVVTGVRKQHG